MDTSRIASKPSSQRAAAFSSQRRILRKVILAGAAFLGFTGCQNPERPKSLPATQTAPVPQSRKATLADFFAQAKQAGNRHFLIAYDGWDQVPFDPQNPFAQPAKPGRHTLIQELNSASGDAARTQSIQQAISLLDLCEKHELPSVLGRKARNRRMSSTLVSDQVTITDVLFCFPIDSARDGKEVEIIRADYARNLRHAKKPGAVRVFEVLNQEIRECK